MSRTLLKVIRYAFRNIFILSGLIFFYTTHYISRDIFCSVFDGKAVNEVCDINSVRELMLMLSDKDKKTSELIPRAQHFFFLLPTVLQFMLGRWLALWDPHLSRWSSSSAFLKFNNFR